jgi:hypothetical protein
VSHASPDGQSVAPPHPHAVPLRHTCPLDAPVQSAQRPELPHASFALPCMHVPAVAFEQQPPLQLLVCPPQDVEHVCVVPLHACPAGQSVALLQPQTLVEMQAWPAVAFVQSTHWVVAAPQTVFVVPGWHVLPAPQQPVGHVCDALHVKVHTPPAHPCAPVAQSATDPQPHCPPAGDVVGSHTCPCVLLEQSLHAPPLLPHVPGALPAEHVPAAQHPPLHGCVVALHCFVHACFVVSHAVPVGQSPVVLQPHAVAAPVPMHRLPSVPAAQSTHAGAADATPHALPVLPAAHVPAALQHPPLHTSPPAHDIEHTCDAGSHA